MEPTIQLKTNVSSGHIFRAGSILLTGGSGKLGGRILDLKGLKNGFLTPTRKEMDITEMDSVRRFFSRNDFSIVIHCAAMARMGECEKSPGEAVLTNVVGTANIARAAIENGSRLVYISTDGVYSGKKGNYSEGDETIPYNTYGWTKLGGETAAKAVKNHCIIRTSFFDPEKIHFETAAEDMYSSKMEIGKLAMEIVRMAQSKFIGTVNIGEGREAEFERYRRYKPGIRKCKFEDIQNGLDFGVAKDSSMDCSLWRRLNEKN